jgi:CBS domain-containing protein
VPIIQSMDIFKLMTRQVFTCRPDDSLATAAAVLWDNDVGCAPVVDAERHVVGMITDRDICMAAYTKGVPLSQIQVSDVMSREIHACSPDQTVVEAEAVMRSRRVRRTPVVDRDGRLVGILSLNDLAREATTRRGRKTSELPVDEVAATLAAVSEPRRTNDGIPIC